MPQIEVRRLQYRGQASQAGRVEFAISDALRTESPDDGRLILVRSLRFGRIGLSARAASQAASSAWRELLGAARHGGSSGAEAADCVWFASVAEARVLLLRELARGQVPFAWFWALAVPDWRRLTLAPYLEQRLAAARAAPGNKAMTALIDEAVAAAALPALATAILSAMPSRRFAGAASGSARLSEAAGSARAPPGRVVGAIPPTLPERAAAAAILGGLPAELIAVCEVLAAHGEHRALAELVLRGLVLSGHPALALAPRRLDQVTRTLAALLKSGEARSMREPVTSRPAGSTSPPSADGEQPPVPAAADSAAEAGAETTVARPHPEIPESPFEVAEPAIRMPATAGEVASAAAGVLLAIVPLIRLGWREWLIGRPELLLHQPGPRLLRLIAAHHRVPASDPIWDVLPAVTDPAELPHDLVDHLLFWRAGLDRWLRRRARVRLVDLASRPGWLVPGPDTTIARFPLDAVDMRLRRLALDVDPGWVDWLGHSYRLVYRDQPLTGPQRI